MSKTITRTDLINAIYEEVGLSRNESSELLESVLDKMTESFIEGESVVISGFATFSVRQKKERIGRNPKTGIEAPVSARKVVTFKPSHILKDSLKF